MTTRKLTGMLPSRSAKLVTRTRADASDDACANGEPFRFAGVSLLGMWVLFVHSPIGVVPTMHVSMRRYY